MVFAGSTQALDCQGFVPKALSAVIFGVVSVVCRLVLAVELVLAALPFQGFRKYWGREDLDNPVLVRSKAIQVQDRKPAYLHTKGNP